MRSECLFTPLVPPHEVIESCLHHFYQNLLLLSDSPFCLCILITSLSLHIFRFMSGNGTQFLQMLWYCGFPFTLHILLSIISLSNSPITQFVPFISCLKTSLLSTFKYSKIACEGNQCKFHQVYGICLMTPRLKCGFLFLLL